MKTLFFITLFLSFVAIITSKEFGQTMESSKDDDLNKFAKMDREGMTRALDNLTRERIGSENVIVDTLKGNGAEQTTLAAIYEAGLYRMERTVPQLAHMIDFKDSHQSEEHRLPMWSHYPVTDALVSIGDPSVPEMVRNLSTSDDAKVRELSALVLRVILGSDLAKCALNQAMADPSNEGQNVTRLKAALSLVDTSSLPK